jgi:penicillin V acylase-like amidase (Ntn superfamily)
LKLLLLFIILITSYASGCTSFKESSESISIMGKNFDWHNGKGEVLLRPRNAFKQSIVSEVAWTSKFASIVFSQFGPDFPAGGINEKGLAIEALVLGKTQHPKSTANLVNEGEWIQYQLDNYENIDEVISNIDNLNIKKLYVPVHYFICDSSKCIIVEYLKGKRVVHSDLSQNVLANTKYVDSLDALVNPNHYNFSTTAASLARFKLLVTNEMPEVTIKNAFKKLNLAKITGYTKWQIVYDLSARSMFFKSSYNKTISKLDFNQDLECSKTILGLNIENAQTSLSKIKGDDYKRIISKRLLLESHIPKEIKNKILKRRFENHCL